MTWLAHVKKVMKDEKGKKESMGKKWFSHVLKTAKKSYKKHKKGGADEESVPAPAPAAPMEEKKEGEPAPAAGRRRRGGKKTRRVKKH